MTHRTRQTKGRRRLAGCAIVGFVVDRLSLGTGAHQVVRTNLPGVVIEGSAPLLGDVLGFRVGGLISHTFFRDSAVTFDFSRMRMLLE